MKATSYLISGFVVVVAFLLVPSFVIRAIVALLSLIGLGVWLVWARRPHKTPSSPASSEEKKSPTPFDARLLFHATADGMREGLLVVDEDMRVVAANAAAYALFKPLRSQLEGQRLTELTRNPAIYSAFLDGLQGIERSGVKVETRGPDRLIFDLRVVPLAGGNNRGPAGALGVFFDVTRTERLELVRQEFLSNVSHELRTPLTSILAFVETLETGAMDDQESSERFLGIIRKNASRMQTLIDDILELTAIEGGNVQLREGAVELHALVNDVISSLASKAFTHGITIVNEVPPDSVVRADTRRLEQMLTNLIDNGIKFGRENGTVTVQFKRAGQDKIIVADNGEGIPAQHLERLFERFYRVDRARSRDLGGTGLGLAIVKHLALLHGGEVTVESEVGKGTTFTIHLPRGQE